MGQGNQAFFTSELRTVVKKDLHFISADFKQMRLSITEIRLAKDLCVNIQETSLGSAHNKVIENLRLVVNVKPN